MPSRRRPKGPKSPSASSSGPAPLSDAQRFVQSLRDSEAADQRAKRADTDRRAEAERVKAEAVEQAERLKHAQSAHQRAVEMVKEATRTGKGKAAADVAWREAKAELLELETGKRPAWAAKPAEPEPASNEEGDDATDAEVDADPAEGDVSG